MRRMGDMKIVTVDEFLATRDTCYSEEEIRAIAGDKKEWTALDVLALKDIPAEDRLFVVLDESFIDAPALHEFSCVVAERALALVKNPDPRSAGAICVKRKWLRGEATDEELAAARYAAEAAARFAAGYAAEAAKGATWAAEAAADAAAADAARAAARSIAWSAARAAADAAAWYAAWAAEREEQVKILIGLLREEERTMYFIANEEYILGEHESGLIACTFSAEERGLIDRALGQVRSLNSDHAWRVIKRTGDLGEEKYEEVRETEG
jgi:hypothetical protein